ncbi:hypothetical protein Tco_0377439 [Tanacetum coccineum]
MHYSSIPLQVVFALISFSSLVYYGHSSFLWYTVYWLHPQKDYPRLGNQSRSQEVFKPSFLMDIMDLSLINPSLCWTSGPLTAKSTIDEEIRGRRMSPSGHISSSTSEEVGIISLDQRGKYKLLPKVEITIPERSESREKY